MLTATIPTECDSENIDKVIALLEQSAEFHRNGVDAVRFDMGSLWNPLYEHINPSVSDRVTEGENAGNYCGTFACVAGYTNMARLNWNLKGRNTGSWWEQSALRDTIEAAKFLGITPEAANELFYFGQYCQAWTEEAWTEEGGLGENPLYKSDEEIAIKHLRRIQRGEGVNWGEVLNQNEA